MLPAGCRSSPRVGICPAVRVQPSFISSSFMLFSFYGQHAVNACGFVHCFPPLLPLPSPILPPPLPPPSLMDQHIVTFLAVKNNIKVIFIFAKAPSRLRGAFPKPDYCW